MSLIYFILVLGITVMIHELGHFIFAKRAGIYIYEFSIGMGPRLLKFKRKNDETEYSIRLLPIGGFVSMAGEDIEIDKNIPKEKQMQSKTWLQRFLTIIAGVLFNFLLAIILLFIVGLVNGVPNSKPYIETIDENYPIATSNIREGDLITKINNTKIKNNDQLVLELQVNNGKTIDVEVLHQNSQKETIKIKPILIQRNNENRYEYGFSLDSTIERGFIPALKYAFGKTFSLLKQMILIISYLCVGKLSLNNLAGPLGIYNIVGEAAKAGFLNIIYLIAYLCINVGLINIIPLPAFDGGRLLFLIIEKIKGSSVNPKVENIIHTVGFALLMVLMIFITYNDILRIIK